MMAAMRLPAALVAILAALALPAAVQAEPLLPPKGKIYAGVTGGDTVGSYQRETGAHPAVFQFFTGWGQSPDYMFEGARKSHSRLMIHISTLRDNREVVTPRGIAKGQGDGYLLGLNRRIAATGPTYIRLMAEMDGNWNPYCAYNANGSSRGAAHTTRWFKRAWKRVVLVVHGGPVPALNRRLHKLHLPSVRTARSSLPRARASFLWVPQVEGAPNTRRNSPRAYWPGKAWVDWVGTDFYSKFPNWGGLARFYRRFRSRPFAFGEWAIWGADNPGFVRRIFRFTRTHRRVRMLLYNQGKPSPGPFRLRRYPRARRALRKELNWKRIAQFTPEWKH